MGRRVRQALGERGVHIGHSEALELVARAYGARDWNTLSARADSVGAVVPVLRIFDVGKAREFYCGYLGFAVDWEHAFDDHAPAYLQTSLGGAVLHLSEHHGDGTPGATVRIPVRDVAELHRELSGRDYPYARPGIEPRPWGMELAVLDPFANRLVFHQPNAGQPDGGGAAAGAIEHEYTVACKPAHAFAVFTGAIGEWWHEAYAPPGLTGVTIEPRAGGACVMRIADGSAYRWGTVTTWDPPTRYAQDFTLAQDADHPSRIDVRFEPDDTAGTRMHFSHGGWNAGNVAGRARFSEWPVLLERFVAHAEGRPLDG